jgi:hypothetical protein
MAKQALVVGTFQENRAKMYEWRLKQEGLEVHLFQAGDEVLSYLTEQQVELLVLLGFAVGDMTSTDLLEEISKRYPYSAMKKIWISDGVSEVWISPGLSDRSLTSDHFVDICLPTAHHPAEWHVAVHRLLGEKEIPP